MELYKYVLFLLLILILIIISLLYSIISIMPMQIRIVYLIDTSMFGPSLEGVTFTCAVTQRADNA